MPLESLSNEQINIHDLTLEQEKQPMPKWQEDYNTLKHSGIYNENEKLWQETIGGNYRNATTHFLDVLIQTKINKNAAHTRYDWLKPIFYNEEKKCWRDIGEDYESAGDTEDQLMAILIEAQFDKEKAYTDYQALKKTSFYNSAVESWNGYQSQEANRDDNTTYSDPQLLDVAVKAQFDEKSAREHFYRLKKDRGYYDDDTDNQWKTYAWRKPYDDSRATSTQLFAVLAEAQFDKEAAEKYFQNLKKSPFYDKGDGQWNSDIVEGSVVTKQYTSDQMLGILCEQLFDKSEPNLQTATSPLPETRSY